MLSSKVTNPNQSVWFFKYVVPKPMTFAILRAAVALHLVTIEMAWLILFTTTTILCLHNPTGICNSCRKFVPYGNLGHFIELDCSVSGTKRVLCDPLHVVVVGFTCHFQSTFCWSVCILPAFTRWAKHFRMLADQCRYWFCNRGHKTINEKYKQNLNSQINSETNTRQTKLNMCTVHINNLLLMQQFCNDIYRDISCLSGYTIVAIVTGSDGKGAYS